MHCPAVPPVSLMRNASLCRVNRLVNLAVNCALTSAGLCVLLAVSPPSLSPSLPARLQKRGNLAIIKSFTAQILEVACWGICFLVSCFFFFFLFFFAVVHRHSQLTVGVAARRGRTGCAEKLERSHNRDSAATKKCTKTER